MPLGIQILQNLILAGALSARSPGPCWGSLWRLIG